MVKLHFYSKDWSKICSVLFEEYANYQFLYINFPTLKNKKSYLLFRYIENQEKFNEAISKLISCVALNIETE